MLNSSTNIYTLFRLKKSERRKEKDLEEIISLVWITNLEGEEFKGINSLGVCLMKGNGRKGRGDLDF